MTWLIRENEKLNKMGEKNSAHKHTHTTHTHPRSIPYTMETICEHEQLRRFGDL